MSAHIGAALRVLRKAAGLTQKQLAENLGWGKSQGRIADYERGFKEPGYTALVQLADALGCDVVLQRRDRASQAEYAWAPDDDTQALIPAGEERARRLVEQLGGEVYVREVTEWRAES